MPLLEKLIGVLAPHNCLSCGREGSVVCGWCRPEFCLPLPSRCYRCKAVTENFAVCAKCRRHSPLKHVWVASHLDGLPQKLVHNLKFERTYAAADIIAEFISYSLNYYEDYLLVPIPTASSRARARGYDQAKLIARQIALSKTHTLASVLLRSGQSRQVGQKRDQRLSQLKGQFLVSQPQLIKGRKIVLIDDVVTTGATLEEAARVLKRAGAKQIHAAVFAQK